MKLHNVLVAASAWVTLLAAGLSLPGWSKGLAAVVLAATLLRAAHVEALDNEGGPEWGTG